LRLLRKIKVRPGHTKRCTCHAKSSEQTWRSDAPQPLSWNQRPDLLTSQMKMSLVLHLPCETPLQKLLTPVIVVETTIKCARFVTFGKVQNPLRLPGKIKIHLPKAVRTWGAFATLTSKCEIRFSGVYRRVPFFSSSTSKSAGTLRRFWKLDFDMCFALKPRTIFQMLQSWGAFTILTSKCASRHSHVHFLNLSTSKNAPTMVGGF